MPVVKLILLVRKRADFTTEQFRARYEGGHVPLLMRLLPFEKVLYYKRNFIEADRLHPPGTEVDYDSITEFAWPDQASFEAFAKRRYEPDIAAAIRADEDAFIESIRFLPVVECNQQA